MDNNNTRVFLQGALVLCLIVFIVLVGISDIGGDATRGIIVSVAGLVVLALCVCLDWRSGDL